MNGDLLDKLYEAEKYFIGTEFEKCVKRSWALYENNQTSEAEIELQKLPTKEQLLSRLMEKLKGKRVFQTLRQIDEGKTEDKEDFLKAMFSLGTHVIIECQQGNKEYRILLPIIQEQIGELIYALS